MARPTYSTPLLRSVARPHAFEPLRVEGRLPESLRGTLFRAGLGLLERFGTRPSHPVESDGAISAVRFDGRGGALGACRLVESAGFKKEEAAGRYLYGSAASWRDRMRAARTGEAKTLGNTSTLVWQNRLFALMEAGPLQEIDVETLDTLDATDLGVVPMAFSAHPHRVESLRTTFNFGLRYGRFMEIDLFALPDEGAPRKLGTVQAPWQSMIHDFMATDRHLLIVLGPVKLNLMRAMLGLADFTKLFQWQPSLGARLIVVPLDDVQNPRTFELDPFWTWHSANAFEGADGPCFDLVRYDAFSLDEVGAITFNGTPPVLARLSVDLKAGRVREERLFDVPSEFPQVHPQFKGGRYDTLFAQTERRSAQGRHPGVTRVNLAAGRSAEWALPAGHVPSEPVLVPRGAAQDDAWVLVLCIDTTTDHSYLAVLDGQRVEDGPVATVHFDQVIPATFHGSFLAAA